MQDTVVEAHLQDEIKPETACPRTNRERMLKALRGLPVDRPPVWLMRQAGRCLPEYRALRKDYSFLDLVRTPALATEVSLQPVRRFNFDAAILFSDILVVPEALGQAYYFRDSGGVQMEFAVRDAHDVQRLNSTGVTDRLQYVASAVKSIKAELGDRTALLGFAGSPWTLANFMLEGGSSGKFTRALEMFQSEWQLFDALCEKLTRAVVESLNLQIEAGADAVQIFDSLGGLLPAANFEAASGRWLETIVSQLPKGVPVIVYSKGTRNWPALAKTGANVIGVDHETSLKEAISSLPVWTGIQGNLNPSLLQTAQPEEVAVETRGLLEQMRGRHGYIFNLGHGVPAAAKLENLEALVRTVQQFT